MKTCKRILALLTACALMIALGAQAIAETRTVYVGRNGAKVYTASGDAIATLSKGTKLRLTGLKGRVCRVSYNGHTGYMRKSDLTGQASAEGGRSTFSSASRTVYVCRSNARLYNARGVQIGSVPLNTSLTCTGTKGSVCRVVRDGRTAYMKKGDLSQSPVVIPEVTPTPAPAKPETVSRTVYAARDGVKVYSRSGRALSVLSANTALTLTAVKGNVCRVSSGGHTGYMRASDLSDSRVEVTAKPDPTPAAARPASVTAYVSRDNAKIYDLKGKALGVLALNTAVTVVGRRGKASLIVESGRKAIMRTADLSSRPTETPVTATPVPVSRTAYVSTDGAKVINASGSVIATLSLNTVVNVTAVKDDICQVTAGGHTGYMRAADLSADRVGTAGEVVDIPNTKGYVNKDGAKVYNAAGSVIATLSLNTAVTVSAYSDSLVQVVSGNATGYMAKADISQSPVSTNQFPTGYSLKSGDSGEAVKRVQRRLQELGYFAGVIGGNYQSLTKAAVSAFQKQAGISVTGVCDVHTLEKLFSDSAPKMPKTAANTADTSAGGTSSRSTVTPARGSAREMDWWNSGIQKIFARGKTATITDVATGLAWREQRRGGTNHADCQPLTAADTAVLKYVYGGKWSWNRRAIFVTINGVNYAASMNGMPHGGGSITGNNFNGHHCIHFTNSRTHGSNKVCSLHQAAIRKALAVKL